jgi:hypothetical protein
MFNPRLSDPHTGRNHAEFSAYDNASGDEPESVDAVAPAQGLLASPLVRPHIRPRLHTICALYAHAPTLEQRLRLLDELEVMTLQLAAVMAGELLEAGWMPDSDAA